MLWWILALAAAASAVFVLATLPFGGWAALGSHSIWIVSVLAAAAFFLMSRGRPRRPSDVREAATEDFASYPEGHVFGVFTAEEANAVHDELAQAGMGNGRLHVFAEAQGIANLDSEGTGHGVTGFTERTVEHLMADKDDLSEYERAVDAGKVVVGVAADSHERDRVREIMRRHGGDQINYFGRWTVESLDQSEPGSARRG